MRDVVVEKLISQLLQGHVDVMQTARSIIIGKGLAEARIISNEFHMTAEGLKEFICHSLRALRSDKSASAQREAINDQISHVEKEPQGAPLEVFKDLRNHYSVCLKGLDSYWSNA